MTPPTRPRPDPCMPDTPEEAVRCNHGGWVHGTSSQHVLSAWEAGREILDTDTDPVSAIEKIEGDRVHYRLFNYGHDFDSWYYHMFIEDPGPSAEEQESAIASILKAMG